MEKSATLIKDPRGRKSLEEAGLWSTHYDVCRGCSGTDLLHHARGYCERCYHNRVNLKRKYLRWAKRISSA